MRKLTASILLAGLPFLGMACTQNQGRLAQKEPGPPSTASTPATRAPVSAPPTFSTNSIKRESLQYTPGAPADKGAALDYVNEKQAVGYHGVAGYSPSTRVKGDHQPEPAPEVAEVASTPEFLAAMKQPLSTFSADVDTASFANVRREIQHGVLPSRDLVRVEEMINYFNYDLPEPKDGRPFSVTTEVSDCPWSDETRLMRVAVKTKSLDRGDSPPRNLVFLLDVSGSMNNPDKLPLLKQSLRQLVDTLDDSDRVAIVVYAGASGLVLPSTTGDRKTEILDVIDKLSAGGSTNGASGIELAYMVAEQHRSEGSVNRVILATDGDFNVGISSVDELKALIEEKRKSGLFLSVLGFGRHGNDKLMETLADNGNGNYASIDNLNEARKVLVREAGATLVTVAKDVKFQVAFDPKVVESYRLIGYKNRRLAAQDFDDDTKDAGELGAGHSVTALYEVRMVERDGLALLEKSGIYKAQDLGTVKLRYKAPDGDKSELMKVAISGGSEGSGSSDQQWVAAVTGFGMLLDGEMNKEKLPYSKLYELMKPTMGGEPDAYETEFYSLVKKSEALIAAKT